MGIILNRVLLKLHALKGGASRQGNFILIVPLDLALKSGVKGHVPIKKVSERLSEPRLDIENPEILDGEFGSEA